jgi:hypothetical protein
LSLQLAALRAQPPAPLALLASATPAAKAPLPEAPAPAITAGPALFPTKPCRTASSFQRGPNADSGDQDREPCLAAPSPNSRFLDGTHPYPLSTQQKGRLAVHNIIDPGNLATIIGTAGFTIGTNSHTAYGPGWTGFGRNVGYSILQESTVETFGTFLIPSLTHQDPRYHRIPAASIPHRALHAIAGAVLAQSDSGRTMPNYSNLLAIPVSTEISNLYVPGVNGNGPSTVARIMTGYTGAPVENLITEFLPDVARHLHIRVIFVQRILNQVSHDEYALP